ncbi:MAG: hypothetical protein ACXABY_05465 [Candidatus Thorarchaeota archaeon]|jgi:long-subunit fatty acid transport protein
MAALLPDLQQYVDLRNGTTIGIHVVTLKTTGGSGDTITVPKFAQATTDDVSAATLRRADANTATITDDANSGTGNTVTMVGTAGQQIVVTTIHGPATINFGDED